MAGRDGEQAGGRAWMKLAQPASQPAIHHHGSQAVFRLSTGDKAAHGHLTRGPVRAVTLWTPARSIEASRHKRACSSLIGPPPPPQSSLSLLRPDGAWQGGIAIVVCESESRIDYCWWKRVPGAVLTGDGVKVSQPCDHDGATMLAWKVNLQAGIPPADGGRRSTVGGRRRRRRCAVAQTDDTTGRSNTGTTEWRSNVWMRVAAVQMQMQAQAQVLQLFRCFRG